VVFNILLLWLTDAKQLYQKGEKAVVVVIVFAMCRPMFRPEVTGLAATPMLLLGLGSLAWRSIALECFVMLFYLLVAPVCVLNAVRVRRPVPHLTCHCKQGHCSGQPAAQLPALRLGSKGTLELSLVLFTVTWTQL
jgi:hypothetical protein